MTPSQEQSACEAWMQSLGFEFEIELNSWQKKEQGETLRVFYYEALFFYRICQKAEREATDSELNDLKKSFMDSPDRRYTGQQVRKVIEERRRHERSTR